MQRGFSLVELSIVLVILGLLTGGILAGQSLIRAAELRSISTEYSRYITATQAFRDKYMALPGDINNAVAFWNRQVNQAWCLPTAGATVTTPGTCNGDGDGIIEQSAAPSQSGERFQFWRQLAIAGLMEGSFSGLAGSSDLRQHDSTNAPVSKFSNGLWATGAWNNSAGGNAAAYAMDYGNYLLFGGTAAAAEPWTQILRPEEAWNIDTKMDDGKPAQGKIIAGYWNSSCAAADDTTHADNDFVASYRLGDNAPRCVLFFRQLF